MTEVMSSRISGCVKPAGLVIGGLLSGSLLLLEVLFGLALTWAWFSRWPPAWPGVLISLVATSMGPTVAVLVWRACHRRGASRATTLGNLELAIGATAMVSLVVLLVMLIALAPY